MKRIYCISGLAADHRLFETLLVPQYELVPLLWATYSNEDTLKTYAERIATQIREENPIIIGLSFGGMLAVEVGKTHPSATIFLVSSAKTSAELGYKSSFLRWIARTPLIPTVFFNMPNFFALRRLGAKTAAEKKMVSRVMRSSNPSFMRWCINVLHSWNNDTYPDNIVHIHGTDDRLIRADNVQANYWIDGGTHIMIYNRGQEVGKIIADCLAGLR